MDRQQALAAADQAGINHIQLELIDPVGIGRGVLLAREYLERALTRGVNFSVTTVGVDLDSNIVRDALGVQAGDFWALGDPATFVPIPWLEHTAHVFADLTTVDGQPWEGCPRERLRRQETLLAAELGVASLGFEQEGSLVTREAGRPPKRPYNGHFFNFDILSAEHPFLSELFSALREIGIEPEKVRAENQFGQIELNTRFGPPLQAVERHWLFKQAFRQIARRHGYIGSFMPKLFLDAQGSGLHLHIGMTDADGRDLFYDPNDARGLELSDAGWHFLGGLLEHSAAILAIGSPTVNSYKRLQPGTWSPSHLGFAMGNRSVFVRVVESRPNAPGGASPKRLELRSPDGTCNAYLLAIAVLAAGRDGVRRGLVPGPNLTGRDTAEMTAEERERYGARFLPRTLDEALDGLEADTLILDALGPVLSEAFLAAKRSEWQTYQASVSHWEFDHYLEHF